MSDPENIDTNFRRILSEKLDLETDSLDVLGYLLLEKIGVLEKFKNANIICKVEPNENDSNSLKFIFEFNQISSANQILLLEIQGGMNNINILSDESYKNDNKGIGALYTVDRSIVMDSINSSYLTKAQESIIYLNSDSSESNDLQNARTNIESYISMQNLKMKFDQNQNQNFLNWLNKLDGKIIKEGILPIILLKGLKKTFDKEENKKVQKTARDMIIEMEKAIFEYSDPVKGSYVNFKKRFEDAVEKARPVLGKLNIIQETWNKILDWLTSKGNLSSRFKFHSPRLKKVEETDKDIDNNINNFSSQNKI